nr:Rnf-Nqr domain containing protein [Pseudomonas fluorescens]
MPVTKSPGLAGSLMLAPLVGVSDTLPKALGFWALSVLIVTLYGVGMWGVRNLLGERMRLIASLLLAATLVSCAQLILQAFALTLYQQLGVYLALISVQCVLLEHSGGFDAGQGKTRLQLFGLFGLLLITLGLVRGLIGSGTLTTLAPGGFILLGLLLAGRQAWVHFSKSH